MTAADDTDERRSPAADPAQARDTRDRDAIRRGFAAVIEPGHVYELRAPKGGRYGVVSGYFDDLDALAEAAGHWDGKVPGIYVTLNPVKRLALLDGAPNRLRPHARSTTRDVEIDRRLRLLVDFDPVRPADVASTDAEHEAALERARGARELLRANLGWPEPSFIDTGNGAALIYGLDLPNDEAAHTLVRRALAGLASLFSDDVVKIDVTVGNASRIARVPFTMNAKGKNTAKRPHRRARLIETPERLRPIRGDLLALVAEAAPANGQAGGRGRRLGVWDGTSPIVQSTRHETLVSIAGALRYHEKLEAPALLERLLSINAQSCQPPQDEADIRRIARDIGNKPPGPGAETREEIMGAPADVERLSIRVTGRDADAVIDDAIQALVARNDPPRLFLRAGKVVAIGIDVDKDGQRRPMIASLRDVQARDRLAEAARWTGGQKGATPTGPPRDLGGLVLSRLARTERPEQKLPPLHGLITQPLLRTDGSLLATPGYDRATGLFFAPPEDFHKMPTVREQPTADEIAAARALLLELVRDFPFVSEADRATALALPLSLVLRENTGLAPLFIFDGTNKGEGKTLLANVMVLAATGRSAPKMPEPAGRDADAEWAKKLTTLVLKGRDVVVVDNVERPLDSGQLSALLTADRWTDRILGVNDDIDLPNRLVMIATGNNVRVAGDLARRCVLCRLDAKIARPWTRTGFRHVLPDWAVEHRAQLLAAVLTLARGWFAAGKPQPKQLPVVGGFTRWAETVGGVLELAGVPDFLGNLDTLYAEADEETTQWVGFLSAWQKAYGRRPIDEQKGIYASAPVKVVDLIGTVRSGDYELSPLYGALPDAIVEVLATHPETASRRVGRMLAKRVERRLPITHADGRRASLRLVRGEDTRTKVAVYTVVEAPEP